MNGFIFLDVIGTSINVFFFYFTYFDTSMDDANLWHTRLCHISQQHMQRLDKKSLLNNINKMKVLICKYCLIGKEGLLDNINKIEMLICEYCLIEKIFRKLFGKGIKLNSIIINSF